MRKCSYLSLVEEGLRFNIGNVFFSYKNTMSELDYSNKTCKLAAYLVMASPVRFISL